MVSNARRNPSAPTLLPAAFALALSACSSTFDLLPEKMGGLPASAPERSAQPMAFPNVYEQRPIREAKPLNTEEQKKLESELATLREQQKQMANPPAAPAPAPPPAKKAAAPVKKPPAKVAEPAKKKQNDPIVPEQKGPVVRPKMVN